MIKTSVLYFFKYIFFSKTRQHLLFIALLGLFISSFALLVLQSTMGGLQHKVMQRSKNVAGIGSIHIQKRNEKTINEVTNFLRSKKIVFSREYEIELLARYMEYLSPVIVHGIDSNYFIPYFLNTKKVNGIYLGLDFGLKLYVEKGDNLKLISPAHVDSFFGDIPRVTSEYVDEIFISEVPEIDGNHVWAPLILIQNLISKKEVNLFRIYSETNLEELKLYLNRKFADSVYLKTWEEENSSLVWALQLEASIMVFLFVAMTFLVTLSIVSGLFIFFNKIKFDLTSFWILGASHKDLDKITNIFLIVISFISVISGIFVGLLFLWWLDSYGPQIMPDIFIDRKIPIYITANGLIISFTVPFLISVIFSIFSLKSFKKEISYLEFVRSSG